MNKLQCFRCGHEWTPRTENKPLSCPSCKSRNWDIKGYKKCECCRRNFMRLDTHHKDGDKKNNKEDNKIKICRSCHLSIHQGIPRSQSRRERNYGYWRQSKADVKTIQRINKLSKLIKFKLKGGHKNAL